jgi:predicted SnoaL-like aldol condensation-catalyzing enzyme
MDAKELVKKAFEDLFEAEKLDENFISHYFHPEYKQYVDGKELNYEQFVAHMKAVKNSAKKAKVTFKHLIAEGNRVCSVHIAEGTKPCSGQLNLDTFRFLFS